MFGVGSVELVALLVVIVGAVAFLLVRAPARRQVADETVVALPADEVERLLFGPIASIRWARTSSATPGQLALASSYTPGWTILVAFLFFPVGLLALLVRPKLVLHVRFLDEGSSTRILVAGSTRPRVAYAIADAVEGLKASSLV